MSEAQFINLRLILAYVKDNLYRAKLEHEYLPSPEEVEFEYSLKNRLGMKEPKLGHTSLKRKLQL